jgi:hypothetical protein
VGGLEVQIHCHKERRTIMFGGKQERMQNWLKEDLQEERDK